MINITYRRSRDHAELQVWFKMKAGSMNTSRLSFPAICEISDKLKILESGFVFNRPSNVFNGLP
jgi:hypothetical protein